MRKEQKSEQLQRAFNAVLLRNYSIEFLNQPCFSPRAPEFRLKPNHGRAWRTRSGTIYSRRKSSM